jgi:hypothetical protein
MDSTCSAPPRELPSVCLVPSEAQLLPEDPRSATDATSKDVRPLSPTFDPN